jgi:hypothetical protein
MDVRTIGDSAMTGWRDTVGRKVAGPVSKRSPLDASQVYAGIGLLFLSMSLWYVGSTLARIARRR